MDLEKIKKFVELMDKEDLVELELEEGDFRISLKKAIYEDGDREEIEKIEEEIEEEIEEQKKEDIVEFTSPMVGIVHLTNLKKEDKFNKGDLLCNIEAMKINNEIKANYDGIILDIFVENNSPVEYGQKMFLIKKL
jgi:biotin carboxyl carrier protein